MKVRGFIDIGRAMVSAMLRRIASALAFLPRGVLWLADACEPGGREPPDSPSREWNPRIWDRTGGRTANEPRL